MPALRVAVTVVAAVGLMWALVSFGHHLPWHRERPAEAEPFTSTRAPESREPDEGGTRLGNPGSVSLQGAEGTDSRGCDECRGKRDAGSWRWPEVGLGLQGLGLGNDGDGKDHDEDDDEDGEDDWDGGKDDDRRQGKGWKHKHKGGD